MYPDRELRILVEETVSGFTDALIRTSRTARVATKDELQPVRNRLVEGLH